MSDHKPYPPFITGRSPSYERARYDRLHPTPAGAAQAVAALGMAAEAEENARQVRARVAEMLADASLAAEVRQGAAGHEARVRALGMLIEAAEGSAPRPEEARQLLAHGPESVVRGPSDLVTLKALARMRDELGAAYDVALGTPELDDAQRAVLVELAADARSDK